MAFNEKLADRARTALAKVDNVEQKMFSGVTFMVRVDPLTQTLKSIEIYYLF
jgi:hypothetical protein